MPTPTPTATWSVAVVSIDGFEARTLLREHFGELIARHRGRPATRGEIKQAMAEDSSEDLRHPTGRFLLARVEGRPAGCGGLRLLEPGVAEVVRLYVRPDARGSGGGAQVLSAAEAHARHLGVRTLRLRVGRGLVGARRLAVEHGYAELGSAGPDPCYEKRLVD